jgi:hypothetical protein
MNREPNKDRDEYLDRAGEALVRAACSSQEEVNSAAAAPFLYARIRARLAAGRAPAAGPFYQSLMMFSVARSAIPVLALMAILAIFSYNFAARKTSTPTITTKAFQEEPAYLPPINESPTPVSACSITSRTECSVSTDDALALLVNSNERQK